MPGSEFGADALAAIEEVGGRTLPWDEACARSYDLVLAASPKGDLHLLRGPRVLLPHGAGYNKSIPGEGSGSASGLDPVHLHRSGHDAPPAALHAVAHPDQVARLAAVAPRAAERAKVIGDPTLERLLASRTLREPFRAALGTGARRLVALASTWGPESLLRRDPGLPARLAALLPYDEFQLALVAHPNEHSRLGAYELAERLAPALAAGMVLARPHEEWASVLVAADALITDHGSAALYYCAVEDRPVVSVWRGGAELIPGSPMDALLSRVPRLERAEDLAEAVRAYRPGTGREAARAAFAHQGRALNRLRTELYALLGLAPPPHARPLTLLPAPRPAARTPPGLRRGRRGLRDAVLRRPPPPPGLGRIRASFCPSSTVRNSDAESERLARSAGLLYRRALPAPAAHSGVAWTADGWARHALSAYPGCRTAVAILPSGLGLLRIRGRAHAYAFRGEPRGEGGRIVRADPAAAASAVHAWLLAHRDRPVTTARVSCVLGDRSFDVLLRPAAPEETAEAV
ncbi:translation initiation factor IF-2 [Streptomyces sp. e14]|nr:translation initiation factor IF-2 [Streptomyces sp. e14]